jgi:hypothetical protein
VRCHNAFDSELKGEAVKSNDTIEEERLAGGNRETKQTAQDDGRVIADMTGIGRARRPAKSQQHKEPLLLTKNEKRQVLKGVLAASLVALLLFASIIGIFIFLLAYVWMK